MVVRKRMDKAGKLFTDLRDRVNKLIEEALNLEDRDLKKQRLLAIKRAREREEAAQKMNRKFDELNRYFFDQIATG